jgi:hypothetical protein
MASERSYDTRLVTPFNCIISGVSQSGKTTLVSNLLRLSGSIFTKKPSKVLLFFKFNQAIYTEMIQNGLIHELIEINDETLDYDNIVERVSPYKSGQGSLIIFDDSMSDITSDFAQIFTNLSHHQNCSVIYITQNLFHKDSNYRTMSLNAHYLFLMKNGRDKQQINTLARQICPGNSTYVVQAFIHATRHPYSYLLLDFRPASPEILKLRSHIFPNEFPYTVYIEK